MKPFLTEAGSQAFDHWNKALLTSLKTAFPGVGVTPRSEISQSVLVKEILNVMIAVPSVNFMLDLVSIYIIYTISDVPRVQDCGIPAILQPMSFKNAPSMGLRAHLENLLIFSLFISVTAV